MTTNAGLTLKIGTRASALAVAQSTMIADRLSQVSGRTTQLVPIITEGDRSSEPLTQVGGTGVFVSALREALVAGQIDVAVHSLKDLPTTPDQRLDIAAIPAREDPRDVVIARDGLTLAELTAGSLVGTGSPRREAQLNALGLDVKVVGLRGNVDTRIGKVTGGQLDAIVLARAGLARLGRLDEITEALDPLQMLSAAGQGALACECRADDHEVAGMLAHLDDSETRIAVTAERSLLAALEAGCSAPVGALGEVVEGEDGLELWLRAVVGDVSGAPSIRRSMTGSPSDAAKIGAALAAEMLADGAAQLMAGIS